MQCPRCGYMLSAFDKGCPRCAALNKPVDPVTTVPSMPGNPIPPFPTRSRSAVPFVIMAFAAVVIFVATRPSGNGPARPTAVPIASQPIESQPQPMPVAGSVTAPGDEPPANSLAPAVQPNTATAPANTTLPAQSDDVKSYITFIQLIEGQIRSIGKHPELESSRPSPNEMKNSFSYDNNPSSPNSSLSFRDKMMPIVQAGREDASKIDSLIAEVRSNYTPADCRYLKSCYSLYLSNCRAEVADTADQIERSISITEADPEEGMKLIQGMKSKDLSALTDTRDQANAALRNVCVQHRLELNFTIQ